MRRVRSLDRSKDRSPMSSANAGEAPPPVAARTTIAARPADAGLFAPLRNALLDSRQRWRDMVNMAADFAFETDARGRFSFIMPDPALGWSATSLLGQPADQLLAELAPGAGFSPFRTTVPIRHHRAWLKRPDGTLACLAFAAAPLLDAKGRPIGVRGLGIDVTEQDSADAQTAATLRRSDVLDHILTVMRHEVATPNVMRAALDALANALGADGAAVIRIGEAGTAPAIAHQAGGHLPDEAMGQLLATTAQLLETGTEGPQHAVTDGGNSVLVCACNTRFGGAAGLVLWRAAGTRVWDLDDRLLAGATTLVVRGVLEQDALQREMGQQARTDGLTGLFNRRAFLEELPRHLDRLDREEECGTLLYIDLDNFKPVNDHFGHEIGDQVLALAAHMLRTLVRPTDLVARLGGDEFAVWMNGADHMTAAERAEHLRVQAPRALGEIAPGLELPLSMSIGIASRPAGSAESIDSVMRRADMAMYAVKRGGRGHWRVSHKGAS
jgi:diguanylate cyclase (GGDEF)-like protein/PAS domain S-box-containing protein